MAEEISVRWDIRAVKGGLSFQRSQSYKANLTGTRENSNVQVIGTADEQIILGADMSSVGVSYLINNDATNFVTIGVRDAGAVYIPLLKLKPGEGFPLRLATATFYAKADTAPVELELGVLQD
jgi:hypothetical protein